MHSFKSIFLLSALTLVSPDVYADDTAFKTGPVISEFGKTAEIETDMPLPKRVKLHVSFDVAGAAKPGEVNRKFDSLARFINMHAQAGVNPKRMKLALVVHGGA